MQFGVSARWCYYLECGHGEEPCNGKGTSVKQVVDMSVKKATVVPTERDNDVILCLQLLI